MLANPLKSTPVTPGTDALNGAADWQHIPGTVTYSLQATGYNATPSASCNVNIAPVTALYFKYVAMDKNGNLSGIAFATDPAWPAVQFSAAGDGGTFTVFQPGGTATTLYLGSSDKDHPQIQYFNVAPGTGGSYTLSWVTANVTGLVLQPSGYPVPGGDVAKGSTVVTPSKTTNYILSATAASGEVVTSTLTVTI